MQKILISTALISTLALSGDAKAGNPFEVNAPDLIGHFNRGLFQEMENYRAHEMLWREDALRAPGQAARHEELRQEREAWGGLNVEHVAGIGRHITGILLAISERFEALRRYFNLGRPLGDEDLHNVRREIGEINTLEFEARQAKNGFRVMIGLEPLEVHPPAPSLLGRSLVSVRRKLRRAAVWESRERQYFRDRLGHDGTPLVQPEYITGAPVRELFEELDAYLVRSEDAAATTAPSAASDLTRDEVTVATTASSTSSDVSEADSQPAASNALVPPPLPTSSSDDEWEDDTTERPGGDVDEGSAVWVDNLHAVHLEATADVDAGGEGVLPGDSPSGVQPTGAGTGVVEEVVQVQATAQQLTGAEAEVVEEVQVQATAQQPTGAEAGVVEEGAQAQVTAQQPRTDGDTTFEELEEEEPESGPQPAQASTRNAEFLNAGRGYMPLYTVQGNPSPLSPFLRRESQLTMIFLGGMRPQMPVAALGTMPAEVMTTEVRPVEGAAATEKKSDQKPSAAQSNPPKKKEKKKHNRR